MGLGEGGTGVTGFVRSANPATLNGNFVDTVRERAYQLYETRLSDNRMGDPVSDWLQAEEQVRRESSNGYHS